MTNDQPTPGDPPIAYAVIYVPRFSLQAVLRHEPGLWAKPVVLVDPTLRTPLICEVTEPARTAGITQGLTPTQAMARCAHVLIRPRSLSQENAATTALFQCAYAFSPHLEATAPGLCTLDLHNLAALAGAGRTVLEAWGRKLQVVLAGVQLSVAVGLGGTPNIARQAVRWGSGMEIVEAPNAFMAALPVAALEPSAEVALLLQRWGIRTVGELLALGQDALTARLGLEALALFAAASSTADRPLHLVHPTECFEESFDFNPEIETLEPLLFLLRRFVDHLSQRLEPRGLVAEELVLKLTLESGENVISRLRLPQPTRQPEILFRTLHTFLETLRTASAVKSVALTVLPTPGRQKQLGLFETVLSDPHQFQETLARLTAVLGPDRVGTPALENSHRPDAFRLAAPDFENAPIPLEKERSTPRHVLPIRRFRPSIKAEVECEQPEGTPRETSPLTDSPPQQNAAGFNRPVSVRCSVTRGKLKILVGPWRASGNWWEPDGWEREEWDAATSDGQVIRLVHQPDGWFVEGVID
jgi:protein ImuB